MAVVLDPNPQSTWGASDEYKTAWKQAYGGGFGFSYSDIPLLSQWMADGTAGNGEVPTSKALVSLTSNVFDGYVGAGSKLYMPQAMYDIADVNWRPESLSPYGTAFLNYTKPNATSTSFDFTTMFEGQYLAISDFKAAGIANDTRLWIDDQEVTSWYLGTRAAGTLQQNSIITHTVDGQVGLVNVNFARRGLYKIRTAGTAITGTTSLLACNAEGKFHKPKKQRTFIVISDSWYDTIPSNTSLNAGCELAARMGWKQWNLAVGGSGFVNPSSSGAGNPMHYGSDNVFAKLALAPAADLLLVNGSVNDFGYPLADVLAAMKAFFARVRAVRGGIPIVWQGCEPQSYFESNLGYGIQPIIDRETAMAEVALADPSVVGIIRPALEDWLTGNGYTSSPNGTGNQDFVTGPDAVHLSKWGTIFNGTLVHQRFGAMPVRRAA